MRRAFFAVLVALGLMASSMYSTAVAAPPQPTYSATVVEGPNCEYTLTASWKNAKVDQVNEIWFIDGTAFENHLFTTQAFAPFRKNSTSVHVGPLAVATELHTITVLVQPYYQGAFQNQIEVVLSTMCTRNV